MEDFEEVIEEAKGEFDLGSWLDGTEKLTEKVSLFTDVATAKELGCDEEEFFPGTNIVSGRKRAGLQGEFADLYDELLELKERADKAEDDEVRDELLVEAKAIQAKQEELREKISVALKKLDDTSIEI